MKPTDQVFGAVATSAAQSALEDLVTSNQGIGLAVLTSGDGFEIAGYPRKQEGLIQRVAAMSSSLQALAEALVREVGVARNRSLIIESEGGAIIMLGIANVALPVSLSVVGAGGVSLGHLLWASRNCCATLERSLKM